MTFKSSNKKSKSNPNVMKEMRITFHQHHPYVNQYHLVSFLLGSIVIEEEKEENLESFLERIVS